MTVLNQIQTLSVSSISRCYLLGLDIVQSYGMEKLFLRSTFPISGSNLKMKAAFSFEILVFTFEGTPE